MSGVKRVLQVGLGTIGCAIARMVTERDNLLLVGAVDPSPDKAGLDIGQLLDLADSTDIMVEGDARVALARLRPDLVLHATSSKLSAVADQLMVAMEFGTDTVSTCEELAYPFESDPGLAHQLDQAARASGSRLLGAGVNPGFVMDVLPAVLSSVCGSVDRLTVIRVVDTDQRRPQLRAKTGVGLSATEFRTRVGTGTLGHVGLTQSLHMLAHALEWSLDEVTESIDECLASATVHGTGYEVSVGSVVGLHQVVIGKVAGIERVELDLTMVVGAVQPRDEIVIDGQPSLKLVVPGGVSGDIATASMVVNSAAKIASLAPGLRTMLDLYPVASSGARAH